MTKQPFNINTILEEFDNLIDNNEYRVFDANSKVGIQIKEFLTDQIRKAMEEVKPNVYYMDGIRKEYMEGYKQCYDDFETNITNFFNMEKEIEKEDFYVCEHHQSTGGYESCCECSDDGPCTEAQLIT